MKTIDRIKAFFSSLPEQKREEMQQLHESIRALLPESKIWFLDGKDEQGKIVTNPNIGYGIQSRNYADGRKEDFYQDGISPNTTGISVYIMGLKDKTYLPSTYKDIIGKATVTGYCIKFKTLRDIDLKVLEQAIMDGVAQTS